MRASHAHNDAQLPGDLLPPLNAMLVTFKRERSDPGRNELRRVAAVHFQYLTRLGDAFGDRFRHALTAPLLKSLTRLATQCSLVNSSTYGVGRVEEGVHHAYALSCACERVPCRVVSFCPSARYADPSLGTRSPYCPKSSDWIVATIEHGRVDEPRPRSLFLENDLIRTNRMPPSLTRDGGAMVT
jgi:hypothetical protein